MKHLQQALNLTAALLMLASTVAAECLPTINSAFNINGIVVGTAIAGGGTPPPGGCTGDSGWGGVSANAFVPINGMPDTHTARLFVSGRASGPNLDRIYIGVHIENDDGFTSNDIVTLYFHPGGGGTFDPAKDFALKIEIGPSTPPSDENCNGNVNNLTYFRFNGTNWVAQTPPAGAIIARTSWDYNGNMPDPEQHIWELELEIHPSDLGPAIPTASPLAIGAKLYVEEPGVGTMAFAYPSGLTTDANPINVDPNFGNVTAGKLASFTIGSCAFDVKIVSISSTDAKGAPSKFTRYQDADFTDPGQGLPVAKRNKFNAEVLFFNPAKLEDMSAVAVPNSGQVNFRIMPWNMNFLGDFLMGQPTTSFTHLSQIRNVHLSDNPLEDGWPKNKGQYDPAKPTLNTAQHVCLKISLNGFTVNLNEPNDVLQQNLTFSQLSTLRDSFLIQAAKQESPEGFLEYLLRTRWKNLPEKFVSPDPDKPVKGRWNYRFPNAVAIGLNPIGNGYYLVRLRPGEERRVEVEITGGAMPMSTRVFQLSPRAGGHAVNPPSGEPPLIVPVKPGMMVTIVAKGLITLDRYDKRHPQNTPEGFSDRELSNKRFLMSPKGAYVPSENIGTLIGSFDQNFRTSFRIGGASSFVVPAKATRLFLAVNDIAGQYKDNTGKGFEINVVMTPPVLLPTRLAIAGNAAIGLPGRADPGANLPRLDIDLINLERAEKLLRPAGYVSYSVYGSHPER